MPDQQPPAPAPPTLPASAPEALRSFVACTSLSVRVEAGPVAWLPTPPVIGALAGKPSFSFRSASPAVKVTLAWLFVSLDLEARVVDGHLVVDTHGVPGFLGLREPIERWVAALDAHLEANGYALAPLQVQGHALVLQKVPRAVAGG